MGGFVLCEVQKIFLVEQVTELYNFTTFVVIISLGTPHFTITIGAIFSNKKRFKDSSFERSCRSKV